jgi:hypothetical protein
MCGPPCFVLWLSWGSEGTASCLSLGVHRTPLASAWRLGCALRVCRYAATRRLRLVLERQGGKVVSACICPSYSPSSRPGALGRFDPNWAKSLSPQDPFLLPTGTLTLLVFIHSQLLVLFECGSFPRRFVSPNSAPNAPEPPPAARPRTYLTRDPRSTEAPTLSRPHSP